MKLGTNDIGSVYLGTNAVQKVYLGTNEVWTSFTGLLDDYPNAAAAYSLRKLSATYTGNAIRVRIDTTGQPEYNIGFVDGELDVATLEGYCTGGLNAYVKTWYDQSGNSRDATQTTASDQPQIVSSGSVILENGKPCLNFDGSDDTLFLLYGPNDNAMSVFNVYKSINNAASETNTQTLYNFGNVLVSNYCGKVSTSGGLSGELITYNFNSGRLGSSTYSRNAQVSESEFWLQSGFTAYQNANQYTLNLSSGWTTSTDSSPNGLGGLGSNYLSIGSIYVNSAFIAHTNIKVQELIFYPSNQSSNRSGIETNINDFYSIY